MPLPATGFPVCSKLIEKKWEERKMRLHAQKVHAVEPTLKTGPPKVYPHMILRLKQIQKEEQKLADIDRANQILLQRMTWILKRKGQVDNWNDYRQMSMNQPVREREQQSIADKNLQIARKLESVKPYYSAYEQEEDYEKKQHLQSMWNRSTRDFELQSTTPRGSMASRRTNSVEDKKDSSRGSYKNKSESTPSSMTKLPKINNNGDTKDSPADQDAKLLFRAVKNLVKPEDAVLKALIRRTAAQRMETKERFEDAYDTNLASELKRTMGTPHHVLIDCLLGTGSKNTTLEINTALKTQDMVKLVNLFTSKSSAQMSAAETNYRKDFDVSLEEDIGEKIPEEDCQALLLALMHDRPEDQNVDEDLAIDEAEELKEAGEGRFSNENGKFIRLIKERSKAQLNATFKAYKTISGGSDFKEMLEEDRCSKDFIAAVAELEKSGGQDQSYWAVKIHSQLTPNNPDLINLLLEKSEQDMKGLRKAYRKKYRIELSDAIMNKCGREAAPLIAQIGTKGGSNQKTGKQANEEKRVNGVLVPTRQKNPPLRGYVSKTPEFKKDNPFHEPMKRPIGEHIRQEAKEKLGNKKQPAPPKTSKSEKDQRRRPVAKGQGDGKRGIKSPNVDDDAKKVYDALKKESDEEALIEILTSRTNEQRQQIRKAYQDNYKSSLIDDMKSILSGDFEEAVLALMMSVAEYDAHCLHDAIDGAGTNESVLIGILTTRNSKELKAISAQYKKAYGETLESAIEGDTSGGFKDLLCELAKGGRDQTSSVDQKLVDQDAKALYQDGGDLDIEDETFKVVMTKRSRAHTKAVLDKYKKFSGNTIEEAIKDALSGDAEDGYIGLVQAINSTPEFYARRLQDAMTGLGTNDTTLIRILVSRSEVDLIDIKEKYKSLYGKTLDEAVDSECSGDYKKLLLSLMKDK